MDSGVQERVGTIGSAAAGRDGDGSLSFRLETPYQRGACPLRVLLPDAFDSRRRYPVLYVLPVNPGLERPWGDGLAEVKKLDLHNRHNLIAAAPSLERWPWYADHPSDPAIRQESFFVKAVLPFVEERFAVIAEPRGRWLLGFSKSGCGAFSLLLRHPGLFGRAAAWDAPFLQDEPTQFEMAPIFGTLENFRRYFVLDLIERKRGALGAERRLAVLGHGNFKAGAEALHERLEALDIPHGYVAGPKREHTWGSGWVAGAVAFLANPGEWTMDR